ncbi:NADH-quinone oxidoreductase subunit NuoG [Aquirhabdus parva]|uniref:NADH-quinone oxidoreductase n=1 Tax=Aquirhabdus parva TaxID=2283318 RepID=A0A345P8G3_9GAMM|nr:NADH-quinone oxidoreductase subunit NuoG [Aquirhabdus parva]AXI03572.1 NADH-quinone oxidoreductase subunit NuoG [Aquirhabdus parva]
MAVIHVDGKQFDVNGADNLLKACLSLGLDIPYFCWHPALGSVGACRQCAVKQYNTAEDAAAGRGRLVMSCMTPNTDNMYISIDDAEAVAFRASVVEWLMTNHPHDCPVCEEGGHCHLQDMTVMTGHDRRRYRFTKRTHQNQYLGPFISHEMNRCISCYRCVRYYNDYAGGKDLGVFGSASNVYFGRATEGVLESEFSGNLVEVCPTGVFTDKTHSERYNRKWDMQYAPSVCQQCSSGCNTSPGERYGEIRRIENRFNGSVNQYFLCDRGRFGYGYVNRVDRPRQPLQTVAGKQSAITVDAALDQVIASLKGKKVFGIGSPRASVETNFALRELVGTANFSSGVSREEQLLIEKTAEILQTEGIYNPNLRDVEDADAVLILGEDITQTAARVALAVRQAAKTRSENMAAKLKTQEWLAEPVSRIGQREQSPIFILSVSETKLDELAEGVCVATPNDIARLGFAVAASIAGEPLTGLAEEAVEFAHQIAETLKAAKKPLVVTGTTLREPALLEAAAQIVQNLGVYFAAQGADAGLAGINLVVPEVNSMGLALLAQHGGALPLESLLDADYDVLVIAENDLTRRLPKAKVEALFAKAQQVIVLDHQATETTAQAQIVLPAASFAEGDGTVVSGEGRAQRYFQVFDASYYDAKITIKEGWRWLHAIKVGLENRAIEWTVLDDVIESIARLVPSLEHIVEAAPNAGYRVQGLKIAREPRRYSGRTSMRAKVSVHEPRQPQDKDSALTFSMEGYVGPQESGSLIPFAWAPGWNSPQSWNKFQDEVGGHLKAGDPGVRLFDLLRKTAKRTYVAPDADAGVGYKLLPIANLYASDEMAARAPVMQERISDAVLTLSTETAEQLKLKDGQDVLLQVGSDEVRLPIVVTENLPVGVIGYPLGQLTALDLSQAVVIQAAPQVQSAAVGG